MTGTMQEIMIVSTAIFLFRLDFGFALHEVVSIQIFGLPSILASQGFKSLRKRGDGSHALPRCQKRKERKQFHTGNSLINIPALPQIMDILS